MKTLGHFARAMVGGILLVSGCSSERGDAGQAPASFLHSTLAREPPAADQQALDAAVRGNTEFALSLYGKLKDGGDNVFFSPFSVTTAMAMAWAGAKGQTATEIAAVFHFADSTSTHRALNALEQAIDTENDGPVATLANQLWVVPSLTPLPAYLDTLAVNYGASVGVVDLSQGSSAAGTINQWVSYRTHGTIPGLLTAGDLPPESKAVLTNALYFQADWDSQFAESSTSDDHFQLVDGSYVPVKMMSQMQTLRYAEAPDYQAAAIPYKAGARRRFEMLVVLPKGDLSAFDATLDPQSLDGIVGALQKQPVMLEMPRFRMRMHAGLGEALGALGMPTAFRGAADFAAMSNPSPGRIDDVIHEGYISVDERGTEASAATAVVFVDGGIPFPAPPSLRLDHPFLLFVRHVESGAILFMGRLANPSPASVP